MKAHASYKEVIVEEALVHRCHCPKVRKSRLEFLTFIYHSRDLSIVLRANAAYLYCEVVVWEVQSPIDRAII